MQVQQRRHDRVSQVCGVRQGGVIGGVGLKELTGEGLGEEGDHAEEEARVGEGRVGFESAENPE